ncbi:MAG: translation initiation factor IF-3 [Clostridiales bacterium]|nr:translation initiation factor IF-3 [Clostridiales bacterium]
MPGLFLLFRRIKAISKDVIELNDRIRDPEVRVIDENGQQMGIMSAARANALADERNLDLVKINPTAAPPVCKIMDYGKFKFDASKREKDSKKNQKVNEMKEIRLSMTIEAHDMEIKARNCLKFLQNGDKVKVSIRMRGRQQAHAAIGVEVMKKFYASVESACNYDKMPTTEGRNILMILAPTKK